MIMAVTIIGRTGHVSIPSVQEKVGANVPTALRARSHSVPGIAVMAIAAGWMFSTCVVTMRPMAMASSAAKMICHTEPGSFTRCQNVFFSG